MKTSNHSHPHFKTSTTSPHWQPHPVHFTKLNRFQSFFSPARRLNLYYILYCFFPWTIKDQSAVLCLMYNTIQFHEQSWASQARGKKFHPLVQFSHLLPPQLPFLLISSPTAVDTFLLLSLSPSHCPNGIVLREEIPKVQSYKIIRGLDNAPRAGKSPQSSHCTTVISHSS